MKHIDTFYFIFLTFGYLDKMNRRYLYMYDSSIHIHICYIWLPKAK